MSYIFEKKNYFSPLFSVIVPIKMKKEIFKEEEPINTVKLWLQKTKQ